MYWNVKSEKKVKKINRKTIKAIIHVLTGTLTETRWKLYNISAIHIGNMSESMSNVISIGFIVQPPIYVATEYLIQYTDEIHFNE